jgi:NTE family protein
MAAVCGLGAASLSGCTLAPDSDHADAEAPKFVPLARKPRVAWVFSSGGPRGFVHVGVLKALAEMGCKPDLLVGASVGALVAVVYAAGRSAREVEQMSLEVQLTGLGRLAIGSSERLSGSAIADLVRREVSGAMLEDLRTPVVCVAARRKDAQVIGFNAGDTGLAVQASSAIEGQFTPVRIRGEQYVDPDLYQPLPVRIARQLGATRVLAIDASAHEDKAPAGADRYRVSDLRKRTLTEPDARAADLTLHPEFGYWVNLSREFRERAIAAGYKTTLQAAAKIAALHA